MAKNIRNKKINNKDISFLNRDFESFRNELIRYANLHYGNSIVDFSESSLAGLFADMAAYVGDVLSFYQDHQFNELSLETVIEDQNLEKLIRNSGITIPGASPSVVEVDLQIKVPATTNTLGDSLPDASLLPSIKIGTIFSTIGGIDFELLENVNFADTDINGQLLAKVSIASTDSNNQPLEYFIEQKGMCTSAKSVTETFPIGDQFVAFRQITLSNPDVNEIISVKDTELDEYYEVKSLTQNTVYVRQKNDFTDYLSVPERIKMIPAPKRFQVVNSRSNRSTTLLFGSGDEDLFDEDVVPDPSEHAVKLFGDRKSVPFISIDPNSFLKTSTLGISPKNTTLTVKYRHGGGINNNVAAGQISIVSTLVSKFQDSTPSSQVLQIRNSLICNNPTAASGGENALTLNELRQAALNGQNSQGRIVTKEDLLARIYSMPNKFGRVFRAGIRNNPFNPFSSHLHVVSRNNSGHLVHSSDTLKENLSQFLEKYRLITDAIDIVDAQIINIGVSYVITIDSNESTEAVIQNVNFKISEYFDIKNFQIDMPIIISEIENIILNSKGVVSLLEFDIVGKPSVVGSNTYSDVSFSVLPQTNRKILYPLPGGIFEIKFPSDDIDGRVG